MRKNRKSTFVNRQSPLPRLILIADGFTQPATAARAEGAVQGGVRWVHLRDHAASENDFKTMACTLASRLCNAAPDVRVSVNARLTVAERLSVGFHTGTAGPDVGAARQALGEKAWVGFSAHGVGEGQRALAAGADYLFFSPIFPTTSKPGHDGVGVQALAAFCEAVAPVPVFALGGVTPARVAACLEASAYGVAVRSGILAAENPAEAARAYLDAFARFIPTSESLPKPTA